MKKILLLSLCALMLCGCADTPPEETMASTETTTPTETTSAETTTETTSAETTTEAPIATETTYVEALEEYKVKLSTMSEEDCKKLLMDAGVEIPAQLGDIEILKLIKTYEEDPDRYFAVSWTVLLDFYDNVRDVVREYYGLPPFEYWY